MRPDHDQEAGAERHCHPAHQGAGCAQRIRRFDDEPARARVHRTDAEREVVLQPGPELVEIVVPHECFLR
jgi:hypothetical protein